MNGYLPIFYDVWNKKWINNGIAITITTNSNFTSCGIMFVVKVEKDE